MDDDPQTLREVQGVLSGAGYTPLVARNPEEALRVFETERPRLALPDLLLPGGDGIELMGKMLGVAYVPVSFLSVYHRSQTVIRALKAGAVDYVVKPFSPTELVARVQVVMRRAVPAPYEASEPFTLGDLTLAPHAGPTWPACR